MKIQNIFFSLILFSAFNQTLFAAAEQNTEETTFEEQKNAFLVAVLSSDTDTVETTLTTITPELLNAQDNDEGWSALLLAVDNGDLMMVKLLLTKHETMNFLLKNKAGETALDIARRKGLVTIASELLKYDVTQSMFDMGEYINSKKESAVVKNVDTEEEVDSDSEKTEEKSKKQKPCQVVINQESSWCSIS